jgi:hypothetical protein
MIGFQVFVQFICSLLCLLPSPAAAPQLTTAPASALELGLERALERSTAPASASASLESTTIKSVGGITEMADWESEKKKIKQITYVILKDTKSTQRTANKTALSPNSKHYTKRHTNKMKSSYFYFGFFLR